MQALLSIHDVMPATLDRTAAILERLPFRCRRGTVLLVVPGLPWRDEQVARLRRWQAEGLRLAGHGWLHEANAIRGLYHRLHSRLLSRRAAEHLALDAAGISELLARCHAWFARQDLEPPDYYVPPAWAMGRADAGVLRESPFRWFETTAGLYDSQADRFLRLPLAGFEADTEARRLFLQAWNGLNRRLASPRRPLRLAIHPDDWSLRLAPQLGDFLSRIDATADYRDL